MNWLGEESGYLFHIGHNISRGAMLPEQRCQLAHWLVNVIEERTIPLTKDIQPIFTPRCVQDTVLGAAPAAGEQHFTLQTIPG